MHFVHNRILYIIEKCTFYTLFGFGLFLRLDTIFEREPCYNGRP